MNLTLLKIARELKGYFLDSVSDRDISIFLCGGAGQNEAGLRRTVGDAITATRSKYRYSVHYPEAIFVELLLGHRRPDLLTLENLLARSVSAVAILLQSPGTFTELGAFSNHPLLQNKLVVVVDPKYRGKRSFIQDGPLRYLSQDTSSKVIFHELAESNARSLGNAISEAARGIAAGHPPLRDLTNPIACYELYLALLYVLDPVPRGAFAKIASALQPTDPVSVTTATDTVVNRLVNQGDALLVSQHLRLSSKGTNTLLASFGSANRLAAMKDFLWKQRVLGLNATLRKGYRDFWGEAA